MDQQWEQLRQRCLACRACSLAQERVPVILGKNGIEKIVELELTADEKEKFAASAKAVHGTNAALKEVGAL